MTSSSPRCTRTRTRSCVAHNHPSGDCLPSFADRAVTRPLREAADLVGVRLTDHLIVTPSAHHSFASEDGWSDGAGARG